MELKDLSLALRRHWLVAQLAFAICFAIGVASALLPEDTYTTTSVAALRPAPEAEASGQNVVQTATFLLPTYVEQLGSAAFAQSVAAGLPAEVANASVNISPSSDFGTGIIRVAVSSTDPQAAAAWSTALVTTLADEVNATEGILALDVLDRAGVPSEPISNATTTLIAWTVLGLIAAVLAALARSRMAGALNAVDEIRRRFDAPVLGEIPRARGLRSSSKPIDDFLTTAPHEVLEAFQSLRTNVELMLLENHPEVIALTSLAPGEGKSTVAAALGTSMAAVGHDVTMIDADLRQPSQHRKLGEPFGEGLANVTADPLTFVRRLDSGMSFLAAGVPDRHPADVIAFALPRAVDLLRRKGALVVIDGPPLRGVAETPLIANLAHHVILVVDASTVDLPEAERAVARLRESGVVLLGVVLNRTRRRRGSRSDPYRDYEVRRSPAPIDAPSSS